MKNRTLFNRVRRHLLAQGKKSKRGNACLYRNGKLSCAVGCLIKDEHYSKELEGKNAGAPLVRRALVKSLRVKRLSRSAIRLLQELQEIHDEADPDNWPTILERTKQENAKLLSRSFGTTR